MECRHLLPSPRMKRSDDQSRESLSADEQVILKVLLARDFPGSDALREQANHVSVIDRPEPNDPTAVLSVDRTATRPAKTEQRVPVEGEAVDEDGARLGILVHVVDGYLDELEFVRYDGKPLRRLPDANMITVITRTSR